MYCAAVKTNFVQILIDPVLTAGTIGTDTIICKSGKIALRGLTVPIGGKKAYTYKWEYSTTSATVGFGPAKGTITDTFYVWDNSTAATQLLPGTYYFRRTVTDNGVCGSKSTSAVTVKITDGLLQPSNASDTVKICSGATPTLSAAAADATNATNPAALNYQWQIRTSPLPVGKGTFVSIAGATGLTYTVPSPIAPMVSDTMYRRISAAGTSKCDSAIVKFYIKVGKALTGGKLYRDTTICKGTAVTLTSKVDPTGGGGPAGYSYVWKQSLTKSGTYATVPGSTNTKGIVIPNVNDTTWYYREVTDATCAGTPSKSDTIKVNIYNIKPGTTGFAAGKLDTTICVGGKILIKGLTVPTGGKKPYTYAWEIAPGSPSTGTIAGVLTDSFYVWSPSSLAAGKYWFRRITKDASGCTIAAGNIDTVKVANGLAQATIPAETQFTICYNAQAPAMSPVAPQGGTNPGSLNYQWFVMNGLTGIPVLGATSKGYTPGYALQKDTVYVRRAAAGSTTCDTAYVAVKITVRKELKGGKLKHAGAGPVCRGSNASVPLIDSVSASGATGTANYIFSWEKYNPAPAILAWQPISGTSASNTYTLKAIVDSVDFMIRRKVTDATCSAAAYSDTVTVKVIDLKVSFVGTDPGPTCLAALAVNYSAQGSGGGTSPSYKWYVNSSLKSATTGSFAFTPATAPAAPAPPRVDTIRVEYVSLEGCKATTKDTIQITNTIVPVVEITGDIKMCVIANIPAKFKVTKKDGGGNAPTFDWYIGTSTTPAQTGSLETFTHQFTAADNGTTVKVIMTSNSPCASASNNTDVSNILTMELKDYPTPTISPGDTTICSDKNVMFIGTVTSGNKYQWYKGVTPILGATNVTYQTNEAGVYSLNEENTLCSSSSTGVEVKVIPQPQADAGPDQYLKEGDAGNLNGSGGAGTVYNWTPNTYLDDATVLNPKFLATTTTNYVLTVTDALGKCKATADVTVFVVKPVKVPNVITVNGDGANDDWEIENIEGYPNVII